MRSAGRLARAIPFFILFSMLAGAAVAGPGFINYKANLTTSTGDPVPDDNYEITFRIWEEESGGTEALWTSVHTVSTHNGSFLAQLGKNTPLDFSIFEGGLLWLGMTVTGDSEMTPRSQIGSVPWAMNAAYAERVKDKSVGAAQIMDKGVGQGQINDKAVGQGQLADKAVGQGQINDKAVGKAQIADKAVGKGQLEDLAVGNGQLDDEAVDRGKLAYGAVGLDKLAQDGALDGQILKWSGPTNAWVLDYDRTLEPGETHWNLVGDILETNVECSIIKAGNILAGPINKTHVNLGRDCQTGDPEVNAVYTTISGGSSNNARNHYCTVGGGLSNDTSGYAATIGGGASNLVMGDHSTVPGGWDNTAQGHRSFAAGSRSFALYDGSVVISAVEDPGANRSRSGQDSQMVLRADGHFYLTDEGGDGPGITESNFLDTSTGAYLSDSGIWQSVSSRDRKENFAAIDRQELLDTLAELEITRWNYKLDGADVQHIGPVAEDFHALFGIGNDDKTISSLDPAGVALAAIQELDRRVDELRAERQRSTELEQRVDELSRQVEALLRRLEEGGR